MSFGSFHMRFGPNLGTVYLPEKILCQNLRTSSVINFLCTDFISVKFWKAIRKPIFLILLVFFILLKGFRMQQSSETELSFSRVC